MTGETATPAGRVEPHMLVELICLGAFLLISLFVRLTLATTARAVVRLAERRGWAYRPTDTELPARYRGTPFGQGAQREAVHVLTGTHRGRAITIFGHQHVIGSGRSASAFFHTVVAVDLPWSCPTLEVSPSRHGARLTDLPGVRDHDVGDARLSDEFAVRTNDPAFAAEILHPDTVGWMLEDARAREFSFRFDGSTLVCWEPGLLDVGRMLAMLDYACDHLDRAPARNPGSPTAPR